MDRWCEGAGVERGEVVPFETVVELGRLWYAGRLEAHWRGRGVAIKRRILREIGLTGPFWELPEQEEAAR